VPLIPLPHQLVPMVVTTDMVLAKVATMDMELAKGQHDEHRGMLFSLESIADT